MNSLKHGALFRAFWMYTVVSFCGSLSAQEACDFEAKLLLSPSETSAAVATLHATRKTAGRVYFFDTGTLDLLSQGVVVRLRQREHSDLTVKLRPPPGRKLSDPSAGREDYKCEVDLTGSGAVRSYSIQSKHSAERLSMTGGEIPDILSAGQKKFLQESKISIDWTRVKRVADVHSTAWQVKSQPQFSKLTLELWDWGTGKILELSTKVKADAGPSAYAALQQLANRKGLLLSGVQQPKTPVVLKLFTDPTTH